MVFYISSIKSRYAFLPVSFNIESKKAGHMACIVVDTKNMKFYLYDPNGKSSYFNNIFAEAAKRNIDPHFDASDLYFDGHILIDTLMSGYISDINDKFGVKYEYVPSKVWNPLGKVLNPPFSKGTVIGSGHCVITTILFLHYLHITGGNIKETFERLGSLNNEELVYLINGYSYWVYQLLEPIFNSKMKNPMYRKMMNELQTED
jgi:hypothetical protein